MEMLGRAIVSAEPGCQPRDIIRLTTVMNKFVISRAMAREVLHVLHSKRLVALQPRAGATVLPMDQWDVLDPEIDHPRLTVSPQLQMRSLAELRQTIEPRAAKLAAHRATADVRRDLLNLSRKLRTLVRQPHLAIFGVSP